MVTGNMYFFHIQPIHTMYGSKYHRLQREYMYNLYERLTCHWEMFNFNYSNHLVATCIFSPLSRKNGPS